MDKYLFNQISSFCYQYLPDLNLVLDATNITVFRNSFKDLDEKLSSFGLTKINKNTIYMIVSAILNLGNIEFDERPTDNTSCIKNDSRKFLCSAAALLKITESELEDVLTCLTREVGHQKIKYFVLLFMHTQLYPLINLILISNIIRSFKVSINYKCC